jgi:streptogramin lyase
MEGVLVSAKQVGTITRVTVVSDERGRYAFPQDRLKHGRHNIEIRAAGYELEKPIVAELLPGKATSLDLELQETQDLASQLTNAEWLLSIPGTQQQKQALFDAGCAAYCHSATRVMESKYDAEAWMPVLLRMRNRAPASRYLSNNLPYKVEQRPGDEELAQYLSSINLSAGTTWEYPLKTLPRPKGKATRVIITEYDLPRRDSQPHDAAVDSEGMVWYDDFSLPYLGRLDPTTLEIKEWKIPVPKPGFPEGSVDIQFDRQGNPWLGRLLQAGAAKFDRETEQFTVYSVPERNNQRSRTGMVAISPDGSVWLKDASNSVVHHIVDPKTNQWMTYPTKIAQTYGMATDSQGDLWVASLGTGVIVRIDAKTGKETSYQPPTPKAGPRRIYMDSQDRFWFAEYYGHKIGRLDTKTKEFEEWPLPTPWAGPYDVVPDKHGEVWAGGMHTDFIFRLNPETGEVTEYLMPTLSVNIRRIDVDNSTNPATVWIGENHQGKIAKIEALE